MLVLTEVKVGDPGHCRGEYQDGARAYTEHYPDTAPREECPDGVPCPASEEGGELAGGLRILRMPVGDVSSLDGQLSTSLRPLRGTMMAGRSRYSGDASEDCRSSPR